MASSVDLALCKLKTISIAPGKRVYVDFEQQPKAYHDDRCKWNRVVVPQAGYPGCQRLSLDAYCISQKHYRLKQAKIESIQ